MMHTFRFTSGEQDIFRRRPYTPLSVWASENIIVKDGPYAGSRFRLDVNPYLAGIMDTWSDPQVEETDICGSAQTGKTSILHCAIAYCVDMRPGPRMLAMQDDDTISKVMTAKLLPLLKASPAIRGKLGKVRSSHVTFHDGTGLFLASAMSPGQRASISIQDLFLDEEALYKQISGQGVPVAEFIERTRSYSDKRKILRVSKPIGGEESSILLALMASGQNGQSFAFNGYLPVKPAERNKAVRMLERRALSEGQSQLFIEAPYRNVKLLEQLLELLAPQTRLTVALDLSAPGQWVETHTVEEWRRRRLPELNRRPAIFIIG